MLKQMARGAIHRRFFLPHSSSASRLMAGASALFILSQSGERLIGFCWKARRDEPGRARDYSRASQCFLFARLTRAKHDFKLGRARVMKALTRDR